MDRTEALVELGRSEGSLHEASLSRIFSHIENSDRPFALITPYITLGPDVDVFDVFDNPAYPGKQQRPCLKRWGVTSKAELEAVNRRNMKDLKSTISGLGYIRVNGVYRMAGGEVVHEPSLFIIGMDDEVAHRLGQRYCQESVLWGQSGVGVYLLNHDESRDRISSAVRPRDFEFGWSEWKGRKFSFQEGRLEYVPQNRQDNRQFLTEVMGALRGQYGDSVDRALDLVADGANPLVALSKLEGLHG